ncbi:zonular occludens toxin domain-containing protein [Alcanivorax sp. IL2]|uniref:zonular occludens toxin domain-containing protein n=1 Tax=Alcanivorax sp. IL2 TaxID=3396310 RepID=UPI0039C1FA21
MFWIFSGKPGSSKTSHVIDFVLYNDQFLKEKEKRKKSPYRRFFSFGIPDYTEYCSNRRPVYYRGIKEVQLPWHELTDEEATNWHEHVPDNAVVIIDEAQELWAQRHSAKTVPPGIKALEKHRHRGLDIIFISLDPALLDVNARLICNEHFHFSRPFGAPFVIEYHAGSGYVNPNTKSELDKCVQTKRPLAKRVYGLYKSAEVHTHKFKPPKILFILPVIAAGAGFMIWYFLNNYGTDTPATAQATATNGQQVQVAARQSYKPEDWGELLKPEVRGLPYTAPMYSPKSRQPTVIPVVQGCMSMKADFSDCTCYTQQGTTILDMPDQMCRQIIKHGIFNHLAKEERIERGQRQSGSGEARTTPAAAGQRQTSL